MQALSGDTAGQKAPIAEFEAYAESAIFSGECTISLGEEGLMLTALFSQLPVPYGEIRSIQAGDFRLSLETAAGIISFSRMGQQLEWLKNKLLTAYNDAVATAFLIKGEAGMEAACEYKALEGDYTHQGEAVVRLYEDCLCILPPNENARRLPLSWLCAMEQSDYSLSLSLATGEKYILSKMGRELSEFTRQLTNKLRKLREQTLEWHKELAPSLSSMQAAAAGSYMPLGRAGDFERLKSAAPPLLSALGEKLKESRIAATFPWLLELCGGSGFMLGAIPAPEAEEGQAAQNELMSQLQKSGGDDPQEEASETEPPPILWLIAPDRERTIAAVELALADNEAAATYLYRVDGNWESYALLIDRALEAAAFQRELILMPEEKLSLPENLSKAMLVKRSPHIRRLRSCFAGRAIHSSMERWKKDIEKCRPAVTPAATQPKQTLRFCTACGAKLNPDTKFCGQCGQRI